MKRALDTNILAYAEGVNGPARRAQAVAVLDDLYRADIVLPVQVLSELYFVLRRKGGFAVDAARRIVDGWASLCQTVATDERTLSVAMQLCAAHRIAFWDAIVLASAAEAGCDLLLSEDFQAGFTWRGVTVVNPFAPA